MQSHPLAESAFGGLAGWKLGAVGVVKGEPAISAPLFRNFVVGADGVVSSSAINMHNLEVTLCLASLCCQSQRHPPPKCATCKGTSPAWPSRARCHELERRDRDRAIARTSTCVAARDDPG